MPTTAQGIPNRTPRASRTLLRALLLLTTLSVLLPVLDLAAQLWFPTGTTFQFPAVDYWSDNPPPGPRYQALFWTAVVAAAVTAPVWLAIAGHALRRPDQANLSWRFATTIPLLQAAALVYCHRDAAAIATGLVAATILLWAAGWAARAGNRNLPRSRRAAYAVIAAGAAAAALLAITLAGLNFTRSD